MKDMTGKHYSHCYRLRACHSPLPFAAMQGQRPGNKPAQGNALGRKVKTSPALKGRRILGSAPSGLDRAWLAFPGRCPGLACWRTFGAEARSTPRCKTGSSWREAALWLLGWIVFCACPALQAEPPKPEDLPPNVEKLIIKTGSAALPEIPFYVRVPKGYTGQGPNRVLFLCPVHNGNGLKTITGKGQTRHLIEAADERQWFVVSVTFDQKGADVRNRNVFYYYPEKFSGKAVLDALAQVKAKYRSIDTDALLLQGFSGGAQFVHRFAIWKPERVTAVAVNSTSWFDAPDERSLLPAWLVTIGESDRSYDHTLTFVEQLRKVGAAPRSSAPTPGCCTKALRKWTSSTRSF